MKRTWTTLFLIFLAVAASEAATTTTTLTVNATGSLGASGITANGTITLSGIGNGTFSATIPLSSLTSATISAPFTAVLSGGNLTGTLSFPLTLLSTPPTGTGSATITGGTGSYAGATGSFPTLNGSGSFTGTSFTLTNVTGSGTITTGGSSGPPPPTPPTITAVLDAASNTANVAEGSIFIVKGSNLCPSGFTSFNVPRPTSSPDGVKITFTPTAGGTGTDALLWYELNQSGAVQLAGILPSTVAPGNYNVTVTNGTASAPFQTTVMKNKFTLFTQDSSGTGLASVQNYISATRVDLNSFTTGNAKATTISPAHPGQFMLAYGTGMGPLVGGDNVASPAFDFSTNGVTVQAIVGGMSIPVSYAGRAGYAGEDQINFALPANVPTGCAVSFQISVNGALSNPTFIAIAPDATSSACVQPGFTTTQLQNLDNGGSFTVGAFSLTQISENVASFGTVKLNAASGQFTKFTGFQFAGAAQYSFTSNGACYVTHSTSTASNTAVPLTNYINLDAGNVTLNGPAGSSITNLAFSEDTKSFLYSLALATTGLPAGAGGGTGTIIAGQYTVTGNGGKDVGAFNASITIGSPLTVTGGLPTTVNRSAGLPLSWTGGNSSDLVEIVGSSSTTSGSGLNAVTDAWTFVCTTTAGTGGFTVPSSILQQLPAAALTANGSGGGFLEVASSVAPTTFSAPLTAGGKIDTGIFTSFLGIGGQASFQ